MVTLLCNGVWGVSALYAVPFLLIGPPTASPLLGTGVPSVSLRGPTSMPADTQAGWYRGQSANPCAAADCAASCTGAEAD